MALWSWRTVQGGLVEVDKGQGFVLPQLEPGSGVKTALARSLSWRDSASTYAEKYKVPLSWIIGVVYAESGGDPKAYNYCCYGLMAIHLAAHHKTKEQMLDPEQNLDYGTSLLGQSVAKGLDLPQAASVHVGGGGYTGLPRKSSASPWGMVEHIFDKPSWDGAVGYIDRVVRANNSAALITAGMPAPPPIPPNVQPTPAESLEKLHPGVPILGAVAGFIASRAAVNLARAYKPR